MRFSRAEQDLKHIGLKEKDWKAIKDFSERLRKSHFKEKIKDIRLFGSKLSR